MEAQRQAEEAAADLLQIESFNRSILDNSGDCIQVLGPDGRVVLMNLPGLALLEIEDPESVQGEQWTTLWHDDAGLAAAGNRRCDVQRRGALPRISSDREGHPQVVGRHRHTHP